MKKFITFILAICFAVPMFSKVVWTENFNYNVGDLTTKTTQDDLSYADYTSWYYTASGTNTLLQVADTNLTYANYCSKATGKAVIIAAKGYKTGRQFAKIESGSVFVSALIKINTLQSSDGTKEYFLYMTPDISGSQAFARLHTKKDADGYYLGIAKFGEANSYLRYSQKLNYGETYLVIMQYDFADGDKNDFVSLYINPTAETTKPTVTCVRDTATGSGTAQGSDSKNDAASIGGIMINQAANTSRNMFIDEVKVATAWADLWEGGSDVKTPTLVVAEDQKSYDFGELAINKDQQTYQFTVTGTDLTEAVTVAKTNADIAVSPASISIADAAKGAKVTVTVVPTVLGAQSDVITISSGKLSQQVTVNWKGVEEPIIDPTAELLSNPSFEEYKPNMMGVQWTDWTIPLGQTVVETTDKLDGEVAMFANQVTTNISYLSQEVKIDDTYPAGTQFELKVNYKVITSKGTDDIISDSYWHSPSVDQMDADADILKVTLGNQSEWTEKSFIITKPAGATSLYVRIGIKKGVQVLFDKFSLKMHESTEPMFTVTPESVKSIEANIGDSVLVGTFTVKQANLTKPVLVEISGTGKAYFHASKSALTQATETVDVYFAPKTTVHFNAVINFMDDPEATLYNTARSLNGTAIDPTKTPTITINPTTLSAFSCKAKETQSQSVAVTSENCIDDVKVSIEQTKGSGFTIDQALIVKNTPHTTVITFCPMTKGDYAATITWTTEKGNTITMDVTGTATEADPVPVDYDTEFVWNTASPYKLLDENFSSALPDLRNKTLKVTDWQNVVKKGTRAWWGYNTDTTTQAKATGYMFGITEPTETEMWLVTPALDYKNAVGQIFTFKVMSDILFEGQTHKLEIYYIDPSDPKDIFFQHLEDLDEFIPYADEDLENKWSYIQIPLAEQPYIPDVFFMAFKFTDMACNNGGTYYVTDVTWGKEQFITGMPTIQTTNTVKKFFDGHQIIIIKNGRRYNILGL